jgi:dTDP-4-dehydrorhamnose 3,5-epimerase
MSNLIELPIDGSFLITSEIYSDSRGSFREWLPNDAILEILGRDFSTAQANFSISKKGTIRGIHYSSAPEGQAKLVTCLTGIIYDVVVDLRESSPTFGKWHGVTLNSNEPKTLYVGPGLGHAFMALTDNSGVAYLLSSKYNGDLEFGINPFDPFIDIRWPIDEYLLSAKDAGAPKIKENKLPKHN